MRWGTIWVCWWRRFWESGCRVAVRVNKCNFPVFHPESINIRFDAFRLQQAAEKGLFSGYVSQHCAGKQGEQALTGKEQQQNSQQHKCGSCQVLEYMPEHETHFTQSSTVRHTTFRTYQNIGGHHYQDERHGDGREHKESKRSQSQSFQQRPIFGCE